MRRRTLLAFALLIGCASAGGWPPRPIDVRLGEDACDGCRMIISDARFGAQLQRRGAEPQRFDDLGCLVAAVRGQPAPDLAGVYVRSFADETWVRGDRAFVVHAGGLGSPMGFDLAAFATREQAEGEAARRGGARVQTLAELIER